MCDRLVWIHEINPLRARVVGCPLTLPVSRQTESGTIAPVLSCAKRYRSAPLLSGISNHAAAALATDKPAQISITSRNPNTNASRTDSLIRSEERRVGKECREQSVA